MTFKEKRAYYKERQLLYESMKSVKKNGEGSVLGVEYIDSHPRDADTLFIWFDSKPTVCDYHPEHKEYWIGNQKHHISNPIKMSNRAIGFAKRKKCLNY